MSRSSLHLGNLVEKLSNQLVCNREKEPALAGMMVSNPVLLKREQGNPTD